MEEKIKKLIAEVEEARPVLEYLLAENAAMAAIIRALGVANAANPVFQASIKIEAEARHVGQLNSTMADPSIEAFKASLNSLLPQQLRDI